MRLRSFLALVAVTALVGACAPDQPTAPTERRTPGVADSVIVLAPSATCAAVPATIRATIVTLFLNAGFGSSSAAVTQFNLIVSLMAANNVSAAQDEARSLADKLMKRYEGLPRARKLIAKPLTLLIIKQIYCLVRMNGVVFDLNPGDPAKAFVTQNGQAGVWFPPNVVQEGTIVSITEITGGISPLFTLLDKYPTFLEVEKSPDLPLNSAAGKPVVGVCFPGNTPLQIAMRLLVGHQDKPPAVGDPGFELLAGQPIPPALAAILTCPEISETQALEAAPKTWLGRMLARVADVVLPAKVQARAMFIKGGVGGSPLNFSPFGAVDPFLKAKGGVGGSPGTFSPRALPGPSFAPPEATITGYEGTTTDLAVPIVTIETEGNPTPTPIPGVTVTFAVTSGDATFCDGVTTVVDTTDATGVAKPACLDFGGTPGTSTVTAAFNANSIGFPGDSLVVVNNGEVKTWEVVTLSTLLIDFKSGDYKYLPGIDARPFGTALIPPDNTDPRAGLEGSAVPADWQTPGFNATGWATALAPFVVSAEENAAFCGLNAAALLGPHTLWGLNTDILIRKNFSTLSAGTVRIDMYIDNDAQVYLDGNLISVAPYTTSLINPVFPEWVIHGGCPDGGQNVAGAPANPAPSGYPVFIITNVQPGDHTIAVRGHDFGGSTYFDMKVTFLAPPVPD